MKHKKPKFLVPFPFCILIYHFYVNRLRSNENTNL
jgi:hypothetical protein